MKNTILNILTLVLVIALLATALVILPRMKCESIAQKMQRAYIFDPYNGCWIQTTAGNWQRIDQPTNYQP